MAKNLLIPRVFGNLSAAPMSYLDDDFNAISGYLNPPDGFNNLSPMTSQGDIIVGGPDGAAQKLASGAAGTILTSSAPGAVPSWEPIGPVADGSITSTMLKTGIGEVNNAGSSPSMALLPGGQFGFYPEVRNSVENAWSTCTIGSAYSGQGSQYVGTTFRPLIGFSQIAGVTYAQQRYIIPIVPPTHLDKGEIMELFGNKIELYWIFFLRKKATRERMMSWAAPTHPCCGGGGPDKVSTPFPNWNPDEEEVVVCTPTQARLDEIVDRMTDSLLAVVYEDYEIDEESRPEWPETPITVMTYVKGRPVLKKIVIPKPDFVLHRDIKLKEGL